ncbi:DUF397 domain-containing protein [Streptomyces sp. NPDC026659]|uniref:DUF397 domain-containing protein n=1 Tax=Streptomyces sp. NPDC026659 TaxID=3155123 RepID=UPI003409D940
MSYVIEDASTLGVEWQKASFTGSNGDCVEAAPYNGGVVVRHSKAPNGPALAYNAREWRAFLAGAKAGEFDHMAGDA